MTTSRILPPEEWPRLAGTEAEGVWPMLDPERARVVVVERDGVIVGCHLLFMVLHAECLWVHPDHRGKAAVPRRLWAAVQDEARASGARAIMTGAVDDRVRGLLAHVGATPVPADQYMIPVRVQMADTTRDDARVGAAFHQALDGQLRHDNHADDPEHNRAVGRALRLGIREGRIDDAIQEYNAWAARAGYVPVTYLGARDGEWWLDMQTAVIAIDAALRVRVVEERERVCHP